MRINGINDANPTFGTRFGPKLTKLLENNKEALHSESYRNLSNIRNNGIDSVLEVTNISEVKQKRLGYKYVLQLHNSIIDKKNDIVMWNTGLYRTFKDFALKSLSEKVLSAKSNFPLIVKNTNESSEISVARRFDDKYRLVDLIEDEFKQAKAIVDEFEKFKETIHCKRCVK